MMNREKIIFCLSCTLLVFYFTIFPVPCLSKETDQKIITLTLEQAVNTALSHNRSLISYIHSLESSRLSLNAAYAPFELKIQPNANAGASSDSTSDIGAGVSLSKTTVQGASFFINPRIGRIEDDYSALINMGVRVPLLRGGNKEINLDGVYSSQFGLRITERNYYLAKVNTYLAMVSMVYNVVRLEHLSDLYTGQIKAMKEFASMANRKKKIGLATPMDVFRVEIRLKDLEDSLSSTLDALSDTKKEVKKLLSFSPHQKISLSAPINYSPVAISVEKAVETALFNRVELEQAMDNLKEVKRRSRIARHNLLPDFDLKLNYERYSDAEELGNALKLENDFWSVNLVSTTDWARSTEKIEYQKSLIQIKDAELNIKSKKDDIISDVKNHLQSLEKQFQRIQIRKEQIIQAKGKFELSKLKYKNGMADNFDVIESEREIQDAEVNLQTVQTDYIVGVYRLRAAMGILIER